MAVDAVDRETLSRPAAADLYRSSTRRLLDARHRYSAAYQAIRADRLVLICDSENSTEAYLACAARHISTRTMAFVIRHTSGLIDVVLTARRCGDLGLVAMSGCAVGVAGPRVSVDAADGITTGISAADRARTARVLADPRTTVDALARPGHVGTIAADDEAELAARSTVDVALELAHGLEIPAIVIAQVVSVSDPTRMAAGDEIATFSRTHRLALVSRSDITAARRQTGRRRPSSPAAVS